MAKPVPLADIPRDAWDSVPRNRRTPMLHHIWAAAYDETLAANGVDAYVIGPVDKPKAIAPFAKPRSGPARNVLLGAEDLWESIEVASTDDASLKELASTLARSGKPFRFGHYPVDTPFIDLLKQAYSGRGIVVQRAFPNGAMPKIQLDDSWREPEKKLNSRRRSDLRRMSRNAEKLGTVTYDILSPSGGELDALLDEAFGVEERNWKGRSGTAVAKDSAKADFYRAYAKRAAAEGILRLCFMRIDGVAAAMQFAVECDGRFWLLKIGYDESYKRCSPGNLLMLETIRYAAAEGLEGYEFLGKEASWTQLWASDARPIATLRTYPFTPSGLIALAGDSVSQVRSKLSARAKPKGSDARA